jgi:amino acid adenylation domain
MSDVSKNIAKLNAEAKRALLAKLLRERAGANGALTSEPTTSLPAVAVSESWSPISHNQKALWFLARLSPDSAAYNLLYAARISSPLKVSALRTALQTLVARYPILTATYTLHDGEPAQQLHPAAQIPLLEIAAQTMSLEEIRADLHVEGNKAIDLEQGPILRVGLYQKAADDYVLALIVHHIAVDFWALDILVDELFVLYAAEQAGVSVPLPAPGEQHSEFVRWQNAMVESPEGERHWHYWQQVLSGEIPHLQLPTDRPRPPKQTYKGASHSFSLSPELTQRLRALANSERVTLFTLMLTAYQALLYRYTGQDDIIVGTPALGRTQTAWERVIDYLANPVLVRAKLDTNPTFQELLAQTREEVFAALDHQDFPFPLLVERLQPKRDPSYSPFYQTLFIWDRPRKRNSQDLERLMPPAIAHKIAQQNLVFEPFAYGQQGAPFDLTLTVFEIESNLSADFRYNVDLFDAATIARIEQHFQVLLEGIVAQPTQHLLTLPLLTQEERQQMLVDWNATQSAFPSQTTLHALVEAQVERTPNATAVIFEGKTRTYRELNNAANHLALRLQELGTGPDTLIGVCMERSIEMVEALLAVLKAGGAYVPMDPGYPAERLAYMLQDSQVPILLTQPQLKELLPATEAQIIELPPDWDQGLRNEQVANPISQSGPEQLAYMIYTSGSTGKPKGVMNTQRGICNRLHWMQQAYQLTARDRVMQKTPFSFDVSVWEFFWPLLSGAGLVVARPGGHQDPAYIAHLIAEQQVTTLHFVPSMLQIFLQEPQIEQCTSLRQVVCSGEALSPEHVQQFFTRFPTGVALHNLYGPTEAAIDVTAWECSPRDTEIVPIGRPIANTQIYILNAAQQPVPVGIAGELFIGGVNVARGYYQRPELTAEKFIDDPFSTQPGAKLFRTADLARYRQDGAFEFLGRIDHQVKIRGFRIELGEIESILKQHSEIKDAIVVAREDTPGNKRLVAYLVAQQEASHPTIEELRSFLKEQLPDYMVPATFMFLTEFPLSPNGKVDRKALPEPDTSRPELQVDYVAPRTEIERTLAKIWSDVLGIEKIGINDNYFDLGGASIQALEIVAKVTEAQLPFALEMIFEFQTIAELATAIETRQAEAQAAANPQEQEESEFNQTPIETIAPASVVSEQPAKTEFANTYIESLGTYLPPKIVTSEELIAGCATPIRFPMSRLTGVKTRRMAGDTEFSIDIAIKAVAACLENSKYNPEDIDMVVCGNISRYNKPHLHFDFEPSTAIVLKNHFGFTNAITFDEDNACTGLFTAAYIIDAFIRAGLIRRGLAVSGEYISHLAKTAQLEIESFMDSRLACLTVGDAGAALILEQAPSKQIGFHEYEMYSLGHYSEACIGKPTDQPHGGAIMYTDAVTVSSVNLKQAVSHAGLIIERSHWPKEAIQHILVHQTSKTTINDVPREINKYFGREVVERNSVINNIAERGNTATTTHMIAIMDHIRNNHIQSGDNAIFGITGSGATIGTALYTFDDLPDRIRRHEAGEPIQKVKPEGRFITQLPAKQRIKIAAVGTIPADSTVAKQSIDLVEAATNQALSQVAYDKSAIDLLIYAGTYRDDFISEPAIAALIQGRLGINDDIETQQDKKTFALDVINGALGTLDAVYAVIGLIRAQRAHKALVVASEVENNRQTQHTDSGLLSIEETGSALLLEESADGQTGFGNFVFRDFPEYVELRNVYTVPDPNNGQMIMTPKIDPQLEQIYLRCIHEAVNELLRVEQLDLSQIDVILPPQISTDFIDSLSSELQVSRERFIDTQAEHDLFTSSLAYTLASAQQQHKAEAGSLGLIINVGAGIQVGCATYHF